MKVFHLTIARVGENLFDGDATSAVLPGAEGVFEILADHEPLITQLRAGEARVTRADGAKREITLPQPGLVEISGGQATVLL